MSSLDIEVPVIGILRGIEGEFFTQVMETSFQEGLQAIEVTLNTPGALQIVEKNRKRVFGKAILGTGTVCNVDEARSAIDAGAMFLVTPNYDKEVLDYANSHNIPVIAGGLTPSEVYSAWKNGAAMVKVFPCGAMGGPQYIKELRGPFDDIPLVAVGGVNEKNLKDYFLNGVNGVGVSTALFGKESLAQKKIDVLSKHVANFIKAVKQIKSEP